MGIAKKFLQQMLCTVTALLESSVETDGSCTFKQFGVAYDSSSLNKLERLETGMQHAIKIQRAILRQGRVQSEVGVNSGG